MSETVLLVELLVVAIVVAIVVKYIRLPYTIALVLAGVFVGLLPEVPALPVHPRLWLLLFLPPLLFEGTINMDLELLKRYATPVGLLALPGTLVSVALLTTTFHLLFALPVPLAMLLAVMLSPTDPVSVLATFKEHGVARGLQTIVEGESVFNDGVAVVLYIIVLAWVGGDALTVAEGIVEFVKVVAGGALVGAVLGYLTHRLYSVIDDNLIEVGLSVALAYGAYLAAERLEVSGVIAVVVAGLIIGNYGRIFSMSPSTRLSLTNFWEVAAFLINGLLFLMIGLTVAVACLVMPARSGSYSSPWSVPGRSSSTQRSGGTDSCRATGCPKAGYTWSTGAACAVASPWRWPSACHSLSARSIS
jgi:CPA1 family monovalent cation:H+ antiporter